MAGQFQIAIQHRRGAGSWRRPYAAPRATLRCHAGQRRAVQKPSKPSTDACWMAMQAWCVPNPELWAMRRPQARTGGRIDARRAWRVAASTCSSASMTTSSPSDRTRRRPSLHRTLAYRRTDELVSDIAAGSLRTEDKRLPCGRTAQTYITDWRLRPAPAAAGHLYGARAMQPRAAQPAGEFRSLTSANSCGDLADHGLDDGRRGECRVLAGTPRLRCTSSPRLQP